MPDYKTHDPLGWGGDSRRGAALGRPTIQEGDSTTFTGKLTLRRVRLNGDYDCNGTYFGSGGPPLYWCAGGDDEHTIDFMLRADSRSRAKELVREDYPNARFYR